MTWMLTANGAVVNLRTLEPASISVLDIAHHLAQINRYTGACCRPYSVAEHSLLVCEIVERAGVRDAELLMAALMHDAHEAYTQDLSTPMKQIIGAAWEMEEARIERAVRTRFDLAGAFARHAYFIKSADLTALATERAQLLPPGGPAWPILDGVEPLEGWRFDQRAAFTWRDWRQAFLDRFAELRFQRKMDALHTEGASL